MLFYSECHTSIGVLRFVFKVNGLLKRIVLTDEHWHALTDKYKMRPSHRFGETVCQQFQEYTNGDRKQIDVSFELTGTSFQKQTWEALRDIPYGEARSYSEIATSIGRPKAVRAVGHANAINPLPILVPCHRVIGKNNKLTGYARGTNMKKQLLKIEGARF